MDGNISKIHIILFTPVSQTVALSLQHSFIQKVMVVNNAQS